MAQARSRRILNQHGNTRQSRRRLLAAVAGVAGLASSVWAQQFRSIEPTVSGGVTSVAAFAADGSVVLGSSRLAPGDSGEGIRADLPGALVTGLGPNTNFGIAATAGAGLIVGNGPLGPFRVQGGPAVSIDLGPFASVVGMAGDGTRLVGNNLSEGPFVFENAGLAFAGPRTGLGKLPESSGGAGDGADGPNDAMIAAGISADGSTIIGNASRFIAGDETTPDSFEAIAAFRTLAGPWQRIFPAGGGSPVIESYVEGVNADGSAIVGFARHSPTAPFFAFVRHPGGTDELPALSPGLSAYASAAVSVAGGPAIASWPMIGGSADAPDGQRAVVWVPSEVSGELVFTVQDLNASLPPEFTGWRLTAVRSMVMLPGQTEPAIAGIGIDSNGKERGWVIIPGTPGPACPGDYNGDLFINLDDLGDFITDFYIEPPIPGGAQPDAPTYPNQGNVGFGVACPTAGDAQPPYAVDAYRTFGFRVAYSVDGSNSCPLSPEQLFPNLDNLNDFITYFYSNIETPGPGCIQ
jgi:hypothetical protein